MKTPSTILKELDELLAEKKPEKPGKVEDQTEAGTETSGVEGTIIQHLALAAQVSGVDLDDESQLKDFMGSVRNVVTKDKSMLRTQLRRWTSGKARKAVKTAKGAI